MRHIKQLGVVSVIVVTLLLLSLAFFSDPSESSCRKITAGLMELHRQWESNNNIPSLYQSLTNLPFQDGGVIVGKGCVSRRHGVLGIKWEEYYFIHQPTPATNASEWTLYHAWYWYPPKGGRHEMTTHKLLTSTVK